VDGTLRRAVSVALCTLLLAAAAQVSACNVVDLSSITAALQNGIDSANRQSEAWRQALPDLANKLADLESQASGDVKATLADTINQVSSLRTDTLNQADYLAKDTIAFALIQAQCSVAYFQSGVVSFLQYLKARVTNRSAPLPAHRVCNFNPDHLDFDPNTPQTSTKTWVVKVYGYNFYSNALPQVQIVDGNNQTVRNARNQPVPTSIYQMELQLVVPDFAQIGPSYRVGVVWPNHDRNFIVVNLSAPASLKVAGFAFPSGIIVNQPVVPRITVSNSGTVDSGAFTISWTPDSTRGRVVTKTELSIPGGQTQDFDLPAYTYLQADYFNTPRVGGVSLQSIVQILGNAGVGANTTVIRTFSLNNLAFRVFATVRIDNPNVGADWTSFQQRVPVKPGDIVTVLNAGGCVQTGGSGPTWKRYVNPDASDEPNLYHGLVSIVPIMPFSHGSPPGGMRRIMDMIGVPNPVPLNTINPQFYLGYEDGNYSDNGYWGHDDGTNNQCANLYGAWVTVQIQRN